MLFWNGLAGSLVRWLDGYWVADRLAAGVAARLAGWLAWLASCLPSGLTGWLADWLAGSLSGPVAYFCFTHEPT